MQLTQNLTLRKKCTYSDLFWYVFGLILVRISHSDQNNSESGHFSRSVKQVRKIAFDRVNLTKNNYYVTNYQRNIFHNILWEYTFFSKGLGNLGKSIPIL